MSHSVLNRSAMSRSAMSRSAIVLTLLLIWPFLALAQSPQGEQAPNKLLGQCAVEDLRTEPFAEWFEAGYDGYTPSLEITEALKSTDFEGLQVDIFFGTWCGDSRRDVPRFLKVLDAMGLPEESRRLIAVDNAEGKTKRSPDGEDVGMEIYRVPTMIVRRDGQEVARIVEHAVLSLERDLLEVLSGDYEPSYPSYPVVRRWLAEGLLADANVNPDGLALEVQGLVASGSDLRAVGTVLMARGQVAEAVKLLEVNRSIFWEEAASHAHLARAQLELGDTEGARTSVLRALARNQDPEAIEGLVTIAERAAIRSQSQNADLGS